MNREERSGAAAPGPSSPPPPPPVLPPRLLAESDTIALWGNSNEIQFIEFRTGEVGVQAMQLVYALKFFGIETPDEQLPILLQAGSVPYWLLHNGAGVGLWDLQQLLSRHYPWY